MDGVAFIKEKGSGLPMYKLQRKNMHSSGICPEAASEGVDLNRNYDWGWLKLGEADSSTDKI